jgi:hypothetical protein
VSLWECDGAERPGQACKLPNEAAVLESGCNVPNEVIAGPILLKISGTAAVRLTCNGRSPNSQLGAVTASHTSVSIADITKEQSLPRPCSFGADALVGKAWTGYQTPLVVAKDQSNASIKVILYFHQIFYGSVQSGGALWLSCRACPMAGLFMLRKAAHVDPRPLQTFHRKQKGVYRTVRFILSCLTCSWERRSVCHWCLQLAPCCTLSGPAKQHI